MSSNLVSFLILICTINFSNGYEEAEGLRNDLLLTENFFQKLINDYESMPAAENLRNEFDKKIDEFVKGLRNPIAWRQRRHLVEPTKETDSGIGVLKGFSQSHENPFPNVLAISVFPYYNGIQLRWFAATLDSSSVSLFLYDGNRFKPVVTYPMTNGSRLIADCSEPVCVLVTSKTDGSVTILRLQTGIQGYFLRPVQYLVGSGDVRLSIWHGMNQIFLGVSSGARIAIYHWLGEHFDSIQLLDYGTGKLTPFKIGGSIYLAVTGRQTTVLRFLLQPNAFNLMQKLPPADDAESFYMDEGHRREHYLVLSNHESTIIYKFVVDHFVPFQIIAKADKISSVTTKETVVLLALTSSKTMKIYQYNGWKFVELGVTMTGVDSIYPTTLDGELILIVRFVDGTWAFNKLNWLQQSTWEVLEAEIKSWSIETMKKAERQPPVVPELDKPLRILQGHVGKLRAEIVNGRNTEKLIQLSTRFDELRLNLSESRMLFTQLVRRSNPRFASIRASKVSGECTLGCHMNNLNTAVKSKVFDKLAKPEVREQNLKFENVKARLTGKLPCPKPAISLKNVIVSKNINGIEFESLREDLLRVSGDQEVTAEHVYARISVKSALIPIEVATQSMHQELKARWIKADNLQLTRGGILVPLNGQPVTVNDTKTVAKVRITGTVHSRGNFNGTGVEKLKPVIWTNEPLKLFGNYSLQQVTITDRITAPDLILGRKNTLNQIINEALPLEENVPVHLKLSKQKTSWSHITANITSNWITASMDKSTVKNITGTKHSPNDLLVTSSSHEVLPLPEFQGPLCASEATVDDVETRVVSVGQASAKTLKTEYIYGAAALNADIMDTATITSANNVTLSSKTFTGTVRVKNASLDAIEGVDFRKLLIAMISWRDPGTVKGVVNASNLIIKQLIAPNGFIPPPIRRARNLYSEGNIQFDTLNTADISALVESVVKLDETVYFRSVAFAGLIANVVRTSVPPIDLSETGNMGTKIIAGNLKAANLVLPYSFVYPSSNIPVNLIIEGSATFPIEPKIVNINGRNLAKLADNIWLINKPSVIFNGALVIEHMMLQGPIQISGWLNSKTHGPWNDTSNHILSRKKAQVINSRVYLKFATARNIISVKAESKLVVPATFLDGLGERSLTKDGIQSFSTSVRFQKLIILGDLNAEGWINGKNLSTDVVRFDAPEGNIVTGKKTVLKLHAENVIGGLNFSEWEKNILKTEPLNAGKPIVINGIKIFANISLSKPLRVEGLLKGLKIENYLLKSFPQEISGTKKIDGSVTASKIFLNGLINDVNLTELVQHQLKKNKPLQVVRSLILAEGDITITGNLRVDGLYHGVALKDLDKLNSDLESVAGRMAALKLVAKQIYVALLRRAWHWNKLELIETNATASISEPVKSNTVDLGSVGSCVSENGLLTCDNETVRLLIFAPNTSEVLLNQVFQFAGAPLFVIATADPNGGVWLYTYDSAGMKFHQVAGLNLPGATRASAIVVKGSLWLAVQLTWDMIILRYEAWGQLEEYNLPGSELFYMETAPTGELLLFRSDGVWRLGGVSGPRQLAKAPLIGNISTNVVDNDYYIQLERDKIAKLKTRYVGN